MKFYRLSIFNNFIRSLAPAMTIAAHNINLVTTCMLSLSSFLIIAAIVITSFLARKEVAINNPEIKVYKHEINISGLLIVL